MRKQILTGIGVLLLGSSMAFAAPQSFRGNFNDQAANQVQQQRQRDQRAGDRNQAPGSQLDQRDGNSRPVSDQYSTHSRRAQQQRKRHNVSRAKHRKNGDRRDNWRG